MKCKRCKGTGRVSTGLSGLGGDYFADCPLCYGNGFRGKYISYKTLKKWINVIDPSVN